MVHLCTADGPFHARVLVARLGADGILATTRGASDGPYPLATAVEVLVPDDELDVARELLLVDDIEAPVGRLSRGRRPGWQWAVAAVALILILVVVMAESARVLLEL